jgi:hypothetical protein
MYVSHHNRENNHPAWALGVRFSSQP